MFSVSVQIGESYLLVVASGPAGPREFHGSNCFLAEMVRQSRKSRVMLDLLALQPQLDASGAQEVLMDVRATMPLMDRLAMLVRQGESLGLVVKAAREKGVDCREFHDIAAAEAWLVSA